MRHSISSLTRSASAREPFEKEIFDQTLSEDAALEKLGYEQELRRSFGLFGMIGFSFSIVTCWTALGGVLIVGVQSGGAPVMIYGWIGVCVVALAVAYSMAEMCSAYVSSTLTLGVRICTDLKGSPWLEASTRGLRFWRRRPGLGD